MADEETQDETETEAAEPAEPETAAETPEPEAAEAETAAPEAEPQPAAVAEPEAAPAPRKRKRLRRALRHKHSKPARTPSKELKPITRTPKAESTPGRRQERRGIVVSDKGDKTIVVEIQTIRIHSKYKKVVR